MSDETSEQVSRPVFKSLQQIAYEASKWHTDADGRKGEELHAGKIYLLAIHKSVCSGRIIQVSSANQFDCVRECYGFWQLH